MVRSFCSFFDNFMIDSEQKLKYTAFYMKRRYFQIIELMKKNPAITQREIAGTLKISLAYVNQILFSMEQDGLLKTNGLPAMIMPLSWRRVLARALFRSPTPFPKDYWKFSAHG